VLIDAGILNGICYSGPAPTLTFGIAEKSAQGSGAIPYRVPGINSLLEFLDLNSIQLRGSKITKELPGLFFDLTKELL